MTSFSLKEVDFLFKRSCRIASSEFFDVKRAPLSRSGSGRVLLVIPRKVGSAPQRNRIRRQIKQIFFCQKLFNAPYDWIIFIKQPINQLSFAELSIQLQQIMKPS